MPLHRPRRRGGNVVDHARYVISYTPSSRRLIRSIPGPPVRRSQRTVAMRRPRNGSGVDLPSPSLKHRLAGRLQTGMGLNLRRGSAAGPHRRRRNRSLYDVHLTPYHNPRPLYPRYRMPIFRLVSLPFLYGLHVFRIHDRHDSIYYPLSPPLFSLPLCNWTMTITVGFRIPLLMLSCAIYAVHMNTSPRLELIATVSSQPPLP